MLGLFRLRLDGLYGQRREMQNSNAPRVTFLVFVQLARSVAFHHRPFETATFAGPGGTQFNAENYEGALYLASQARALARGGQSRLRAGAGTSLRSGETLFVLEVPLQTASRSNVRDGPGISFGVLFTLDAATSIVGQSYTDQWVRVADDQGREGWIFHTLVTAR